MKAEVILSCRKPEQSLTSAPALTFHPDTDGQEMNLLQVYGSISFQQLDGFGGAFTQSSAKLYERMGKANQARIMELLFSKTKGLGYTCGRIPIGACDFSTGNYAYTSPVHPDFDRGILEAEAAVPMILEAKKYCPELELMASPWSPPAHMKTNGRMCGGGKLLPQARQAYAAYLTSYLHHALKLGLPITRLSLQNEPKARQTWESCLYTAREEGEFLRDFLIPEMENQGLGDIGILLWDHNKERAFLRAREILSMPRMPAAIRGIAFHWYSGDHFENLELCRRFFPDMELVFSEGCVELKTAETNAAAQAARQEAENGAWAYGECYAHDIIGDLNAGMNRFIDWNLLLDTQGGPNHVGNYCSAPILCDPTSGEIAIQPSYRFLAHFSRFLPRGSRRVALSRYTSDIQAAAARTPDGQLVLIAMNATDRELPVTISDVDKGMLADTTLIPHSIVTVCWQG